MSLKSINPTKTNSWLKLKSHYNEVKENKIYDYFKKDKSRVKKFSIDWNDFYFDYSKNKISEKTIELFDELFNEIDFKSSLEKYFNGDKINISESRSVLHTALRSKHNEKITVDGKDIFLDIIKVKEKIKSFSELIISGQHKGFRGDKITDVVNIGIGGSDLGPSMVVKALSNYKTHLKTHFVSNVDGDHVYEILSKIKPESTIFIIVSKTFTTTETITNANTFKNWFLKKASLDDMNKHFIAVSSNQSKALEFGIQKNNILPIWNWVGGRFSLWSSAGISISLSIGYEKFSDLLEGARLMDEHFRNTDFKNNIPVILACLTIWYNNFFQYASHGVIPYSENLIDFSKYLQQASMESNGKQIDRSGDLVDYQTGQIVWGQTGTNAQHSFFQLLHQGTRIIPLDFIGFCKPNQGDMNHHNILMSNFFAQPKALMIGSEEQKEISSHKFFKGNRPSNSILIKKLTPHSLGSLIAMYEHKIFTLGVVWNILSYDQFGVELGKNYAKNLINDINNKNIINHDLSTENLLKKYLSSD